MANPLSNEAELFEKIKKDNIRVNPLIWELIDHYVRNDFNCMVFLAESVVGEKPEPIPVEAGKKMLYHIQEMNKFLNKLKEATIQKKKSSFPKP